MYCYRHDCVLLLVYLFALLPAIITCSNNELKPNSPYQNYGYVEYIAPEEDYIEVDKQADLGEGFILENILEDLSIKTVEKAVEIRSRRDVANTSSEDIEEDDGSGEITLSPSTLVPKVDVSPKKKVDLKPPVGDIESSSTPLPADKEKDLNESTTAQTEVTSVTGVDDGTSGETDIINLGTTVGASSNLQSASGIRLAPILIAAATSGFVFFFIGFFLDKCRRKKQDTQNPGYSPMAARDGNNGFSHPEGVELQSIQTEKPPENRANLIYESGSKKTERGESLEEERGLLSENPVQFSTFKATSKHQSPINIDLVLVKYEEKLTKHVLTFKKEKKKYIVTNTGRTVKVAPDGESAVIAGGPLGKREYLLDHFHFHWGSVDSQGSEHLVNGKAYAAELHLVFSDTKIVSFEEAVKSDRSDALAVMAVFIEVGTEHGKLKTLTNVLGDIEHQGASSEILDFDVTSVLPANTSEYWTYNGSLTTPPYSENVLWIVYKQPIQLSPQQFNEFRKLRSRPKVRGPSGEESAGNTSTIGDNFRKTQPVEDRHVLTSFR